MKNPYAEAIECLVSGKSLKPVIVKIAQDNPSVLVKAFRACYDIAEKPDTNTYLEGYWYEDWREKHG